MNMIQSRPEEKAKSYRCKFNPKNWQSKSCSSTHLQSPVSLLRGVSSVDMAHSFYHSIKSSFEFVEDGISKQLTY